MQLRNSLLFVALATAPLAAQPPADDSASAPPAKADLLSAPTHPIDFDIATFKPTGPNSARSLGFTADGFSMGARPLHDLIRYAYAKTRGGSFQLSGQPAWVDTDLYDIQARVAPEDMAEWKRLNGVGQKVALQGFLAEYLKLKEHDDTTPHPCYALVVGKSGVKMKRYVAGDTLKLPDGRVLSKPDDGSTIGSGVTAWPTPNDFAGLGVTIPRLMDQLAGHADKGILDQTGLDGHWNFILHFDDQPDPAHPDWNTPFLGLKPADATPAIFTAVRQLGLELKPINAPMDGIVLDHIERPPGKLTRAHG